jgi:hypothetical protein
MHYDYYVNKFCVKLIKSHESELSFTNKGRWDERPVTYTRSTAFLIVGMVKRNLEILNFEDMQRKTEQCMQMSKSNRSFHRTVPRLILHFVTNELDHCHQR